ncbi:hypothetical protein ACFLYT_01185 [Nanoarchaeota archaeon]
MDEQKVNETLALGGNIELTGFKDIDNSKMVVLKKMVGNYVRKLSDSATNFERLSLTMKSIGSETSNKYEVHGKLVCDGKVYATEVTDRNIFIVTDSVLKKIENSMK